MSTDFSFHKSSCLLMSPFFSMEHYVMFHPMGCLFEILLSFISFGVASSQFYSRKEVFQPHLPVRLPCYDLAPVIGFTLGRSLRLHTLGTPNFHGLTGGVYKARERIHRVIADTRLLANPTSRGRVADLYPNCEWLCEIGILLPASCPLYHPL
jgi:hypothetical protein